MAAPARSSNSASWARASASSSFSRPPSMRRRYSIVPMCVSVATIASASSSSLATSSARVPQAIVCSKSEAAM